MESHSISPYQERQRALTKITDYLENPVIQQRFASVVGRGNVGIYISSVLIACKMSDSLLQCTPESIYLTALRAATLRLSCDPNLGQAYPVAFKGQATLIVGYKGLYDLAIRTGKYRFINSSPVYQGQDVLEDQITGELTILGSYDRARDDNGKIKAPIIGWIAAFELGSREGGLRKALYMSKPEIHAHARKYSRGYSIPDGSWVKDTEKMERKTVLRLLIRRWGYLDPADQAVLGEIEGVGDVLDAESSDISAPTPAPAPELPPPTPQAPAPAPNGAINTKPAGEWLPGMEDLGVGMPIDAPTESYGPAPDAEEKQPFSDEELDILVNAKLASSRFSASGMLSLSNLKHGDPADILKSWGGLYREIRPLNAKKGAPTSQAAAAYANSKMPRP